MGKKKANQLGRSLIKDRFGQGSRKTVGDGSMLHTTEVQDGYDWGRLNLQSVTEESSFQEFLRTAELAGTEFQAEKLNISYVNPKSKVGLLTTNERVEIIRKQIDKKDLLKIPRRPRWTKEMTPEELHVAENGSFLEWRRGLVALQEDDGMLLTPYEKNLDFWRQLWRVVERSDIVVQIVDARNPLLFRTEDLEQYVKEVDSNKLNMILINKSDFLTDEQRECWAKYFDEQGVRVAFYSAVLAAEEAKREAEAEEQLSDTSSSGTDSADEAEQEVQERISKLKLSVDKAEKTLEKIEEKIDDLADGERKGDVAASDDTKNNPKLLTNSELIALFKRLHHGTRVTPGIVTVGLVGYPNVGKSSTINAVFLEKKVSVSATPGKTKHFQTLYVDSELMFCDCPGLVMPSFCITKADMILNGILPIDQMRDHVPPVNLLCTLIPRHVLEDTYGIMISKPLEGENPTRPPHSEELLLAFAYNRGFMTANGQPDQSRGSRYVLKDYVNGKLLYCYAPPGVVQEEFHRFPERQREEIDVKLLPPRQQRAMKMNVKKSSTDIDEQFFKERSHTALVRGRSDFPHLRPLGPTTGAKLTPAEAAAAAGKPWKHQKREKREKLRRKYVHLDQH
ncbi:nucleostemin 3 [Anopheles darlingi]|uniref:Large subunit GTPase 1 homolog n=1 Tax=Anopheles darlingi TaxID=43151 RepID=W5JR94_ANODA|nr:large subunit GTPase 1 homolog [Anopheles darlingi]ETN66656.1 nucleostemin 3 [Anopheles darlingi]